jgi:hypothetical protein
MKTSPPSFVNPDPSDPVKLLETLASQLSSSVARLEALSRTPETQAASPSAVGELQELRALLKQSLPLLQVLTRQTSSLSERLLHLPGRPPSLQRLGLPGVLTVLLLLALLTFLRPHWLLSAPALRTYELGREIEEIYPQLSPARQSELRELLSPRPKPH